MQKIEIGKLRIDEKEEYVRVVSKIKSDKDDFELWFETEKEYKDDILVERSDGFLIAIFPYAIKKELDIIIHGKISEKLYYQMTTYLIPMMCKKFKKRIIKISAELDNKSYNNHNAVGTGISCGIDSFYTVCKHINREEESFNLTHLTFLNAGASGEYGGEIARKLYYKRMIDSKKFALENNFKFVAIDTNMNEFLMMNHEKTHTFRSLACILILQKLFSKYYYSSGLEFDETKIDEFDTAYYDILNVQCLSTEDLTFYSTGMEVNRIEKTKEIVNYKPTYKFLNVCINEEKNCGICEKCIRTMLGLDSINRLEDYKDVFDINKFNKNKMIVFMLRKVKIRNVFYIEILNQYRKSGYKIPLKLKLISMIPNIEVFKYYTYKIIPKETLRKVFGKDKKIKIDDTWSIKK